MKTNIPVPECSCPMCGHPFDMATPAGEDQSTPVEDDLSVCINCAALLVFNPDLTVRLISKDEYASLPAETQIEVAKMAAIVATTRAMHAGTH